jgi:hypothetical protein
LGSDNRYIPVYPPTASDYSSGDDPFIAGTGYDRQGSVEVNDVINLLPLIQKLSSDSGNGELRIDIDTRRIAMMGMSRGGMEAYIVARELSDETKYGNLPRIQCMIVKGALSHYPGLLKDIFDGKTFQKDLYTDLERIPRIITALNAGNFNLFYPVDYDELGDAGYPFWNFFPESTFPVWNDADLASDEWPECGTAEPPPYPDDQICSEEYYYRSAPLWTDFWSQNQTPVLVLHGKGDTQILWDDAQDMYDKMIALGGDPAIYSLKLFDDSDDNCEACSFLVTDLNKIKHCDHWLVEYDFGFDEVIAWLEKYLGITIDLDIKPESDLNCINNKSHGVIPVAILGSPDSDCTQIDPESILLEGLSVKTVGKNNKYLAHYEDVNSDGHEDLVLQIQNAEGHFGIEQTRATLRGNLYEDFGGTKIVGYDAICIVP